MAIVFTKDIHEDVLLLAYNNNVVRFNSDTALIPKTAQITGLGIDVLLYPHPNGSFYFNFKEYIESSINTKNFIDDFPYTLDPFDPDTFAYDVSDGAFLEDVVTFKINFTNNTNETTTKSLTFISAVEQLDTFKGNEIVIQTTFGQLEILSPVKQRGDVAFLKYWKGYPFEFSFYKSVLAHDVYVYNMTSATGFQLIPIPNYVTSLFITDGQTTSPFISVPTGLNHFEFEVNGNTSNSQLDIMAVDNECGVYVKFLNKYGRYNYWLFSKFYFKNRSSKYMDELNNDFENLEDTVSPTLQIGKLSDSTLKCMAKKLNEAEKMILEEIIDSPKILLFKGAPGTISTHKDWIEVKLKTTSFQVESPNKKLHNFQIELDLPNRNTITL
jgi:hypothetical protein